MTNLMTDSVTLKEVIEQAKEGNEEAIAKLHRFSDSVQGKCGCEEISTWNDAEAIRFAEQILKRFLEEIDKIAGTN